MRLLLLYLHLLENKTWVPTRMTHKNDSIVAYHDRCSMPVSAIQASPIS